MSKKPFRLDLCAIRSNRIVNVFGCPTNASARIRSGRRARGWAGLARSMSHDIGGLALAAALASL
jgi:hypothetical protein